MYSNFYTYAIIICIHMVKLYHTLREFFYAKSLYAM